MSKRFLTWAFACFVVSLPTQVRGQWTHFNNNADIRAFHQIGDTLWIGTNGGLLTLDLGTGEVTSKITAGPIIPDNSVRAIAQRGHQLYVGSDYGLSILAPGGDLIYHKAESPAFGDIRSISFSVTGEVYLGTFGHGVGVLADNEPTEDDSEEGEVERTTLFRITRQDSLLDNKVFAVAPVDTGRVYFATSLGFCAYRDSAWVGFQAGAGLPRGEVKQLLHIEDDQFYLLIRGRGIYRFNDKRGRRIRVLNELPSVHVATITVDSTGALWAGGRFGGIARHQGGSWTLFGQNDPELSQTKWRCAYTGPGGSVYFGSADGLIAVLQDGDLRTVRLPSDLPSGFVGPMVEDGKRQRLIVNGSDLLVASGAEATPQPDTELGSVFALARAADGAVWVSTPWGLLRREGGEWQEIRPEIEPRPPVFLALSFDAAGQLWAGAHSGEVFRFDGTLWVPYAGYGELGNSPVSRLLVDSRQAVWAVTRMGGVHRFEGFGWQSFGGDAFGSEEIRDATLDAYGTAVVVTDYGVWKYEVSRRWVSLQLPFTGTGKNRVVRFDSDNRMYLGKSEGLAIFGPEGGAWLGAQNGLRGKEITSLLIDSDDVLWVGFRTDGISRIPLESLWEQALSLEEL